MSSRLVAIGLAAATCACGRFGFGGDDGGADGPPGIDSPADIDAPPGTPDAPGAIDAPPPISGLIARYSMDDDPSDGVITDASESGLHGACVPGLTCPEPVTGHLGEALRFDGTSNHVVRIVSPSLYTDGQEFTISAWLYLEDPAFDQVALARPVNAGSRDSWGFVAWQNGPTCFETTIADDVAEDSCAGVAFPDGSWIHVAGVTSATSKDLWISGVRVGQNTGVSGVDFDDHDIVIGMDENGGSPAYRWHGKVDEVQLYDRALTTEEIAMLAAQ
jgi:arabinan endo-1,5-alpha-L-arabinosidase